MLGVCVGGGAEPVEPAVEVGLVPGLEVEVLPAWVEDELEAEVLPPSPALQGRNRYISKSVRTVR